MVKENLGSKLYELIASLDGQNFCDPENRQYTLRVIKKLEDPLDSIGHLIAEYPNGIKKEINQVLTIPCLISTLNHLYSSKEKFTKRVIPQEFDHYTL